MEKCTAIVTGGGDGIGKAICSAFLEQGYRVAAFDNRSEPLEQCRAEFAAADYLPCVTDVMDQSSVEASVRQVLEQFRQVDVLVNNVGGSLGIAKPVEDITLEEFESVISLNLRSTFLCCKTVIPAMKERRHGRIINMSSMAGRGRSVFGGTPYAAAKSAVIGFCRQSSKDLGPWGITINAIAPGTVISSERIRGYWETNRSEEDRQKILDMAPVGRMGEGADIAAAALYLAGESASYITGAVLDVNGGAWVG